MYEIIPEDTGTDVWYYIIDEYGNEISGPYSSYNEAEKDLYEVYDNY